MLFSAITIAAIVVGGGTWYMLRPIRNKLTQKELDQIVAASLAHLNNNNNNNDDNLIYQVVPGKLSDDDIKTIVEAFRKSPDFRWIYAGSNKMDQIDNDKDMRNGHYELLTYLQNSMLRFIAAYGTTIVVRDTAPDGNNKLVGTFSLLPPGYTTNKWLYQLHFLSTVVPMGMPIYDKQGSDVSARFDAFDKGYNALKTEVTKGTPHWTVEVVAVAGNQQGRGIGRKLLTLAKAIVDSDGTPAVLECHDGNLPFYQKMGFIHKSEIEFRPTSSVKHNKNDDSSTFHFNCLTYMPNCK